jgi:hypothetical protein
MNYQIGKYYQIHHIVVYIGGDVVPRHSIAIVGILASCNILQHLLLEFVANIRIVVGFAGLVSGLNYSLPGLMRLISIEWYNRQLDQEYETCVSYQIGKYYQIYHIVAYIGSNVVLRHCSNHGNFDISQHPSISPSISYWDLL